MTEHAYGMKKLQNTFYAAMVIASLLIKLSKICMHVHMLRAVKSHAFNGIFS